MRIMFSNRDSVIGQRLIQEDGEDIIIYSWEQQLHYKQKVCRGCCNTVLVDVV